MTCPTLLEARKNPTTAPTTIYMPGGPGTSFLDGDSGFPCMVNDDSNSTTLNPWSWNNEVNMLYIDMPGQTGYSYSRPADVVLNVVDKSVLPLQGALPNPATLPATLSSQEPIDTANTTSYVADQMWRIAQVFFQE
jgi:hypothetical protein